MPPLQASSVHLFKPAHFITINDRSLKMKGQETRLAAALLVLGCLALANASGDSSAAASWKAAMGSGARSEDSLGQLVASVFGGSANLVPLGNLAVNELLSPGARAAERLQQLSSIVASFQGLDESCGVYTFSPGGAATSAKWVGPTFTLTQTTGSCVIQPAVVGEGNTRWTQAQATLACTGPSTSWAWTPLTYEGPSVEPATLEGPSCQYAFKLGAETSVTLSGDGPSTTKFESEKEFYTAFVLDKALDLDLQNLRSVIGKLDAEPGQSRALAGILGGAQGPSWRSLLAAGPQAAFQAVKGDGSRDHLANLLAKGATRTRGLGSRTLFGFKSL